MTDIPRTYDAKKRPDLPVKEAIDAITKSALYSLLQYADGYKSHQFCAELSSVIEDYLEEE